MNLDKPNNPPPIPENNPYAPPSEASMGYEEQFDGEHFGLLDEPRQCEAGRGIGWIIEAFNMFKQYWALWIGMAVVYIIITMVIGSFPLASLIFWLLFAYHFNAGFMLVCAEQEEGYEPLFGTMFSAFQSHLGELIILCLWSILFTFLICIPIAIFFAVGLGGLAGVGLFDSANPDISSLMTSSAFLMVLLVILVGMLFYIPLLMAMYIAPALIVLHDIRPLDAMKMSFKGCLRNMIPFLLFGLIALFAIPILFVCTLGLGLLIIVPIMIISNYVIYRDIWSGRMAGE